MPRWSGGSGAALTATQTAAILAVPVHPTGDDYALPDISGFTQTSGGGTTFAASTLAAAQGAVTRYIATKAHEGADAMGRAVKSFSGTELIMCVRNLASGPAPGADYSGSIVLLRESGTNKMATVNVSHKASTGFVEIDVAKYSSDTTWVTNGTNPLRVAVGTWVWVRLVPLFGTPTTVTGYAYAGRDVPTDASQWTAVGTLTSCFTTAADQCGFGLLATGVGAGLTARGEFCAFRVVP